MKNLFRFALLFVFGSGIIFYMSSNKQAAVYKLNSGSVSFFSTTPAMNIDAVSNSVSSLLSPENNSVAFVIQNKSFKFKNSLMEDHFNEKYMESDKYPRSSFSGKINEALDLKKNGVYKVTCTGKLNIHGVEQLRTIPGEITVKDGKMSLNSTFMVKLTDHKIEVPSLVFEKIAEEIKVTVDTGYNLQ